VRRQEGDDAMAAHSGLKICVAAMSMALGAAATAAAQPHEVEMALAGRSLSSSLPLIANDLGLFEKHGIKAKFVTLETADATATALLAGSVQIAFSSVGPLIAARTRGQKLVAINSTYKGLAGSLVLSKAAADRLGVSPTAPLAARLKALDGLIIASSSPTSSYTLTYRSAAAAEGSKPSFTYMQFPAMPAALATGAIQGYVSSAPFWMAPVSDGSGHLWISGPAGELRQQFRPAHTSVTLALQDYAEANPQIVRSVVAALNDFVEAIDKRPQDVRAAMAKYLPTLDQATIDRLFAVESTGWKTQPITPAEIAHEIAYVKASIPNLPPSIDAIDPATLLFR
jgi:ABC-type nitrate/sulfonate/bicarbonate transport system substrate-binding protein